MVRPEVVFLVVCKSSLAGIGSAIDGSVVPRS